MNVIDGGNAAGTSDLKKCFVISPIGKADSDERRQADSVLKHIIRAALSDSYEVLRADDESNPGAITPTIINSIATADLIVADISGGNANVFYELAIAHGYDRPTVHIQSAGNRVPFDIKDMRTISYDIKDLDSVEEAKSRIISSAAFAVKSPAEIETPLKGAQNFQRVATSEDPSKQVTARILEEIQWVKQHLIDWSPDSLPGTTDFQDTRLAADGRSFRAIITAAGKDGQLSASNFIDVVNSENSSRAVEWMRRILKNVDPSINDDEAQEILSGADPHWARKKRTLKEAVISTSDDPLF